MGDEVWGLQWMTSDSLPLIQKTKSSPSHGPALRSGLHSNLSQTSRPLDQLSLCPGKPSPLLPFLILQISAPRAPPERGPL